MALRNKKLRGDIPNGTVFAQNAEFFAQDLDTSAADPYAVTLEILGAFTANRALEMSLDSGANWIELGSKSTVFEVEVLIKAGELINFRTPDAAGVTIEYFRVAEIIG